MSVFPLTFLGLFDDLPQGFLQAVGPEHQLLLGPVRFTLRTQLAATFYGARADALLAGHRTCWHHLDVAGKEKETYNICKNPSRYILLSGLFI